ncbi:MAG: hypothetical protein IJL06_05000 [Kiritimatiellae bacterium]|nr:hypothetical protein [Kiritimatiellia bacterium]
MNGTHPNGILTVKASGALRKGEIVKFAGENKVAEDHSYEAVGATLDAAADGALVPIALFGAYPGTILVRPKSGSEPAKVSGGMPLDASGKYETSGALIGRALGPADADGLIEIAHRLPVAVGVAAGQVA